MSWKIRSLMTRLVVRVQRKAGAVEDARALQSTRLDLEHVISALAVAIDPLADRISGEGRINLIRPGTPIGKNATKVVDVLHQDVGGARRNDELRSPIIVHDARHAWRDTDGSRILARAPRRLVGQTRLPNCLIFPCQWRLLTATRRLAWDHIEEYRCQSEATDPSSRDSGFHRTLGRSSLSPAQFPARPSRQKFGVSSSHSWAALAGQTDLNLHESTVNGEVVIGSQPDTIGGFAAVAALGGDKNEASAALGGPTPVMQ